MSQVVNNSGITYGNNNTNCGNTTNISIPDEKRKILEWISPFTSRERHQAVRDSRVEKVGDWLLCNQRFSTWRTSEDQTAKPVLFCYGHPGAGKTYISSLVIDTLLKGIDGDDVAVAYVYCDFTIQNMQSTSAVLGSVLRQVVGALAEIPDEVQGVFEKAKRQADGCGLRLPEILDMLTKFLPSLSRAFICIDALDEFPTKQRAQLWNSLQRMVRECPNTRLFLTGRPQIRTEVEDYLAKETEMVAIEPTLEDIIRYIEERLNEDLDKSAIDEGLREDIRRVVPKRVSGMFLLVCLGMDEILGATTIYQKKQALDRIANGLGLQDAYNATLDRIRQQDSSKSKLGMAVLMWVSRCERPLRWAELRHALGVDLVAEAFATDNVPSVRTVLACTLGLVTIDEKASAVRLLHLTLQEYLRASPTIFKTPQSTMADTCLTYLNTLSFQAPQRNSDRTLNSSIFRATRGPRRNFNMALNISIFQALQRPQPNYDTALSPLSFYAPQRNFDRALDLVLEKWPFLEYATHFWGTHAAREVTEEVKSRALRLLDGYESHISARILLQGDGMFWWSDKDVHGISGLHCIAFLGIVEIAVAMLEKQKWNVNGRDSRGDTPLMWALRYGNNSMVELLLEQRDIRLDMVIRDGRTVFSLAAGSGEEGAVKFLLERGGVNPNLSDNSGRTPLSFATERGHEGIVKLLLESREVNPDSPDSSGRTPLSFATERGLQGIVKLLLKRKEVNPDSRDSSGRTPLSFATERGHQGVVRLLLEHKDIDPDRPDSSGRTPLSFATERGDEGVVKLLLEHKDIDPNRPDSNGRTPLSFTALGGHEGVMKLLLERKEVNPDSREMNGRTPLSLAALGGCKGVVKLLLACGDVNLDSPDGNGQTPLSLAASRGHEGVVELLLGRGGVNPNSLDRSGRPPLSYAAAGRRKGAVRLLVESQDIDPNLSDSNGLTPLSYAAMWGREDLVSRFLNHRSVNPNTLDSSGRSPLSYVAAGKHSGVLKLLVESSDIDPNSSDSDGLTPLSYAAMWGREDLVSRFLNYRGVNPNLSPSNGRTPLSYAALEGHEGVVKLLLKHKEVNPDSLSRNGRAPLSLAASRGHEGIVGLLLECENVNPDSSNMSGRTPLSFAAERGNEGIVKLLLERKEVNPDSPDGSGRTPLSFATKRGHQGIVKLLLKRKEANPDS